MTEMVNNLFGFSTTVAVTRATAIGLSSLQEKLCLVFTTSFGYDEYISKSIYQQIKKTNLTSTSSFGDGTPYDIIEQKVYDILNASYPNESEENKKILALTTNALIFSYYNYSGANISDIQKFIGQLLFNTCEYITKNQLFNPDKQGIIHHPFSVSILDLFLQEDYESTTNSLVTAAKDSKIEVVNYNWMETEDIFAKPNLSLMKDIENQYYYLSGNLLYSSVKPDVDDCIDIPVTINTTTGQVTFNYYLKEPCVEKNSYIGPISGIKFYRVFNDGPYTSGDFNTNIKNAYIEFDKNVLNHNDYKNNNKVLYSFLTGSDSGFYPIAFSPSFIDGVGRYDLNTEYSNIPESYDCSLTYSGNMHIGDNEQKIICDRDESGNCFNCRFEPMTGFKFASLELDEDFANNKFTTIKTNPASSIDNIRKRALNILPYSYLSSLDGDSFVTNEVFFNQRYLGYPQLSGKNSLPNIAFFQSFDSKNFNRFASISMYPSIGTSYNGIDDNAHRQYDISPFNIFSGASYTHVPIGKSGYPLIKFLTNIPSSGLVSDEIAQKFFGMGNNFNNQYNFVSSPEFNAGLEYTGYYLESGGNYTNIVSANIPYENNFLGSPVNSIKFISGYRSTGDNKYLVKKIYAQDNTGGLIPYYNLKNEDLPSNLQIDEINTSYLTPLPYILESEPSLSRINGEQIVENYIPRYSSGAFSTYEKKFLYPNAQLALDLNNGKTNGFPVKINFTLNIREEAVRELYADFLISNHGLIASSPKYKNVIRATDYYANLTQLVTMQNIFKPNNAVYNYNYDFNNFPMNSGFSRFGPLNYVDNNWSPLIYRNFYKDSSGNLIKEFTPAIRLPSYPGFVDPGYSCPSGKNNLFAENEYNPFFQGVRLTGDGALSYRWYTGTGDSQFQTFYTEKPFFNGLYHYYTTKQINGYLLYNLPYFDLSLSSGYINDAVKEAFAVMVNNSLNDGPVNCQHSNDVGCGNPQGSFIQNIDGTTGFLKEGVDPIFLEYMGGRSGGLLSEQEGGFHSQGLVGDKWNHFSFDAYGMLHLNCRPFSSDCDPCSNQTRTPSNDSKLVLISSTPKETNIFTRALAFNPFVINQYEFKKFNGTQSVSYKIGDNEGLISLSLVDEVGKIDLNDVMPLKDISGDKWYDNSGLILGPFDRDVELGVLSGDMLYPNNADLYCNNNKITDIRGTGYGCDALAQFYSRQDLNSGIFPGRGGRDANYTIFAIVAKGNSVRINLSGTSDSGQFGFSHLTDVSGRNLRNTLLSIRPRKLIGASIYDSRIHKGENSWVSPFSFLNNGLEKKYTISTNNFFDLANRSFTMVSYSKSGKLYPVPNEDFTGKAHIDINGNFIYPSNATVENYWKDFAVKNNQSVVVSGWREGSRLSFQFTNISLEYDAIPYQTQKVINPSGNCIVSGEMGYLQQADNSIYTAGVILKDNTAGIQEEFDPYIKSFSSDVLKRLPWITGLSGKYPNPILEAPSVMIQRSITGIISGGQKYHKLLNYPPYNYNKLSWAASSDLEELNNGTTLEAVLPSDPITFNNSTINFSASQGQDLPNGNKNPDVNKTYDVVEAYQMYDSIATDALINSGKCLTSGYGTKNRLDQQTALSGIIAPIRMTLSMIKNGFV